MAPSLSGASSRGGQLSSRRSSPGSAALQKCRVRDFPNGDSYQGEWVTGMPQGEGLYFWQDGSYYEGSWQDGVRSGVGTYVWPNGARYHGEWRNGTMHGVGMLQAQNGASYEGGWAADLKHGLGKKVYANGDVYEGLWRHGKAEGPGRYRWRNSNEYDGQWLAGRMHGQGTLIWAKGDRYDGEFKAGQEDGVGIFSWADGATYEGFWKQGQKHGIGLYRPVSTDPRRLASHPERPEGASAVIEAVVPGSGSQKGTRSDADAPIRMPLTRDQGAVEAGGAEVAQALALDGGLALSKGEAVFVREYEAGRLARSEALTAEEVALIGAASKGPARSPSKRQRKKAADRAGETIYKGHRSYDLMLNLQLGIRHAVGSLASALAASGTSLPAQEFASKVKVNFPRIGSSATPPHPSGDFKWKDYCPTVFKRLRDVFNINPAQYMLSICGDLALRELPSPGKSGSMFFLSHDDRYMIKTMRKGEVKLLLALLPKYAAHVAKYPHTLLIKFYGLHRVRPLKGAKVRFIVMNNLFCTGLPIHRRYDLKGSTQGRGAGVEAPPAGSGVILKDLDLDVNLKLEEGWHDRSDTRLMVSRLAGQLREDCRLLEELRVMDYSLLLGIHFRSPDYGSTPQATDKEDAGDEDADEDAQPAGSTLQAASEQLRGMQNRSHSIPPPLLTTGAVALGDAPADTGAWEPSDASGTNSPGPDGDSEASRAYTPPSDHAARQLQGPAKPASMLTRLATEPLRQDSQPPSPEPESALAQSEASTDGPVSPSRHTRGLSRFGKEAKADTLGTLASADMDLPSRAGSEHQVQASAASDTELVRHPRQSRRRGHSRPQSPGSKASEGIEHTKSMPSAEATALVEGRRTADTLPPHWRRSAADPPSSVRQLTGAAESPCQTRLPWQLQNTPQPLVTPAAWAGPGGWSFAHLGPKGQAAGALPARVAQGFSAQRQAELQRLAECHSRTSRLHQASSATLLLAMRPQRSDANRPVAMGPGGTDQLAHALGETRVSLGANMVAVAQLQQPLLRGPQPAAVPAEDPSAEQDVVVFFGIIDILQEYNVSKRLEHSVKSLRHDGSTISAVGPRTYSHRFQHFISKVFV